MSGPGEWAREPDWPSPAREEGTPERPAPPVPPQAPSAPPPPASSAQTWEPAPGTGWAQPGGGPAEASTQSLPYAPPPAGQAYGAPAPTPPPYGSPPPAPAPPPYGSPPPAPAPPPYGSPPPAPSGPAYGAPPPSGAAYGSAPAYGQPASPYPTYTQAPEQWGEQPPPPGAGWPPAGAPPGAWYPAPPGTPKRSHKARNIAIGAVVVVVVLVVAAATLGTTSHPVSKAGTVAVAGNNTAATPAGYQTFVDQQDRFGIDVPSTWREINPSSPGAEQAFQQVQAQNPGIKSVIGGGSLAAMAASGVKFFAIEPVPENGFSSNININVHSALGITDGDIPEVQHEAATAYAKAGATVSSTGTVTLSGHKALRVSVNFAMNDFNGNRVSIPEVQYFVGANDLLYVITLSGQAPELSTIATTFQLR